MSGAGPGSGLLQLPTVTGTSHVAGTTTLPAAGSGSSLDGMPTTVGNIDFTSPIVIAVIVVVLIVIVLMVS